MVFLHFILYSDNYAVQCINSCCTLAPYKDSGVVDSGLLYPKGYYTPGKLQGAVLYNLWRSIIQSVQAGGSGACRTPRHSLIRHMMSTAVLLICFWSVHDLMSMLSGAFRLCNLQVLRGADGGCIVDCSKIMGPQSHC